MFSLTSVATTIDNRRAKMVLRLETLLDILYVAIELDDNGLADKSRPRRFADSVAEEALMTGSDGLDDNNEARSISQSELRMALREKMTRLMKKCCRQSCNVHDLAQVCPSSRLTD